MIGHLAIGSLIIAITVALQAELFNLLSNRFELVRLVARRFLRRFANTGVIIFAVLYVLFVQTVNVWIWGIFYRAVGAFDGMEPSLYFSLVTFTTVGYGDLTLGADWRLLSGLEAANGFLNFGWSTAFMVELVRRTS
jgi:hypothetical protein